MRMRWLRKTSSICILLLLLVHEATSNINCQCHLRHSLTTRVGIACRKGSSGSPVCTKEMRPSVPQGYRYIPGFGLFKLHVLGKTYNSAQKTCEREGGRLAIPQSEIMAGAMAATLFTDDVKVSYGFVGINDIAKENEFRGSDGELAPWLNWNQNEPNNLQGAENCVHLNSFLVMTDVVCGNPHPFICERKLKVQVPPGYVFVEGQGFYKAYKEKLSHKDAEAKCRADGAHLAVPETQSEGEALVTFIRTVRDMDVIWIGITDDVTEGEYVTVHGTPLEDLDFSNWNDREPDDVYGEEDCVGMLPSGALADGRCHYVFTFVCELVI